jgi:REP element-mobilizing transposase RayT
MTGYMRQTRQLAQGVWYEIHSGVNNREPILKASWAAALFDRVFRETMLRFPFEVRGLRIEADRISFYIKPEDGLELPAIMQWMKQVFAQRYNALTGRSGHIWGDRYWSRILEGEPPEGAGAEAAVAGGPVGGPETGVRPRSRKRGCGPGFSPISPSPQAPAPG